MAQLPMVQLDWWKDPEGYRLAVIGDGGFKAERVVRNGRPDGKLVHCEPLKEWPNLFLRFAKTVTTPESMLKFVQEFGPLTLWGNDQGDFVQDALSYARIMRHTLKWMSAQPRQMTAERLLGHSITLNASLEWDPASKSPVWQFWPSTLIDGLWLQLGQAVTRGDRVQTCMHCGELFVTGLGTDRRLDAKFCLDEHRIAFNSLKRSREM